MSAQSVNELSSDRPYVRIAQTSGWMPDPTGMLTYQQVKQPAYSSLFQPIQHDIGAFGITKAAVWVHGRVSNPATNVTYLLIEFSNIDSLTLYYEHGGELHVAQSGSLQYKPNPFHFHGFTFELPANDGKPVDFWLRARTGNALIVPLAAATAEGVPTALADMYIVELIYLGVVTALFFYNLLLFFWVRDKAYLWYLGYLVALAGFNLLYLRGFHYSLGPRAALFFNQYGIGLAAVSYMFTIGFSVLFLRSKKYAPVQTRILRWIFWLLWVPVICLALGWRVPAIRVSELCSFCIPVLFIWMSINAYRKGYKPALYFLIAWTALLSCVLLFVCTNVGLLHYGTWSFHILPIGSGVEMILLSLALGHRYALLKKEKIDMQAAHLEYVNKQKDLLEEKVSLRTQELAKMMQHLRESNTVKDKLLGIISHDLRTPLGTLSGLMELLEMKALSPQEIGEFAQMARQHIKHINSTMHNMLNWSLSQMNRIETRPEKVELAPLFQLIADTYRFSAGQKNIRLEISVPPGATVFADDHQLELVIRNLVDNAIKFTPRGGVISFGARDAGGKTELYVTDSGNGLTSEAAYKILYGSKLYSTDGTANEKGTGLGLWLCKEFVANNGGELHISSIPGKGSTFYFRLPKDTALLP
ncbi:7TM diverse intracellular signaling domain-containing protein [Chitinophaga sp. GCM10012297]|uniref:histidine kinase n=1 Tax=Chitinophaga chungangae TaxID=2821488 RepID=A0ABS3YCA5_9BACT|nr:sensor histidine kinase [Chitinophaga chungangae]MBO9152309.1 sensor histidine kinase [Chitinophaga chungangae]